MPEHTDARSEHSPSHAIPPGLTAARESQASHDGAGVREASTLGRCDWTDAEGNARCNNFTEFQCQQAGGTWDPAKRCPDSA